MTQELPVSLRITADSAGAQKDVKALGDGLKDLKNDGDRTAAALDKQKTAVDQLGATLSKTERDAQRLAAAQVSLDKAYTSGLITQERQNTLLAQATQRWGAHNDIVVKNGISAGQTTQAFRQLPAQFTDIITSLQGGQAPLTVLIQQGGQIKDSFGGIGPAIKQLTSLLTLARVAIGGTLGVLAGAALAYKQGSDEASAYTKAVTLNGGAAGVTAGQLADMAANVDKVTGTQAQAAEGLALMAGTGEVAARNLEQFTAVAIDMESTLGQAVGETVKTFAELGKAPLNASIKLNETINFLTVSVYSQIKALQEQGRTEEAGELAQTAYANAMASRVKTIKDNLGTLESAWKSLGKGAAEAWDEMLNIGRGDTLQAKLDKVAAQIEKARQPFNASAFGDGNAEARAQLAGNLQLQASLQEMQRLEKRGAESQAARAAQVKARIAFDKDGEKYLDKTVKLETALTLARNEGAAAGASQAEIETRLKNVRTEFAKGAGKGAANAAFRNASADAGVAMARMKADLSLLQDVVKNSDAIIEQALKDGNVTLDAAYQARLSQINTATAAERAALTADRDDIDKALAKAKTAAERGPLTKQGIEIDARLKLLDSNLQETTRQLGIWKTEQEKQLSTITAKVRVEVANLTGQFDRGALEAQIKAQYDGDYKAAGQLPEADQSAVRARIDLLVQAGVAQAEFNAKLTEAQRIQAQGAVQEEAVRTLATQGAISQTEAEARIAQARAAQVPQLEAIVQGLRAMRDALPPEAAVAIDQMSVSIGTLKNQIDAAKPSLVDLGTKLQNTAIDGLADAAAQAMTNFSNLRDLVKNTLKQMAADILRSGVKSALKSIFTTDAGGGGGGGSLISTAITAGKALFGFAEGGHIQGPGTGTSDSIPALVDGVRPIAVSHDEFIQPQKAVRKYGLGFMEAVRTLRLPKPQFAFGGLVQAQQRARFATGGQVAAAAAGGAGGAPNVSIQFVNQGTAQRVTEQSQQLTGKDLVVRVVLADLASGGPISQGIRSRGG